jgi:hypothetical protein
MVNKLIVFIVICFKLSIQVSFAQEWKNLKTYQLYSQQDTLTDGHWLKKDRLNNTTVWQKANAFNLSLSHGYVKYKSISEIRDLYLWFDEERKKQGHDVIIFGVAAIVAEQLSHFDNYLIRTIIVKNKEVINFGNEGSKNVLTYFFPYMKTIYFSKEKLTGKAAENWDKKLGKFEQCDIVEPIYTSISTKGIKILTKMAKGKGIYRLKVKKDLRYEGEIRDCELRYTHAFTKLYRYYLKNPNNN